MSEFGEWIRRCRSEQGLTQAQCAARARMKVQQWNRMEKTVARPEYDTLCAVADALVRPLDDVLRAASYPVHRPEAAGMRLASQIEQYLSSVPPTVRPRAEQMIIEQARRLSEMLTSA